MKQMILSSSCSCIMHKLLKTYFYSYFSLDFFHLHICPTHIAISFIKSFQKNIKGVCHSVFTKRIAASMIAGMFYLFSVQTMLHCKYIASKRCITKGVKIADNIV
jgi:hypothetical protein